MASLFLLYLGSSFFCHSEASPLLSFIHVLAFQLLRMRPPCAVFSPPGWSYEAALLCRDAPEEVSGSSAAASGARRLAARVLW